ncbi:single-stranded DNA-binding protein, partial [Nocardiopsis alba]
SYETREGEKRTVFEVDVEEVGPALRSATAKVTKTQRQGGGGFGGGQQQGGYAANGSFGQQQQGSAPAGDPWGQGGKPGFSDDAPPF